MALIQCPNCGQTISDKAAKCPKCGIDMIQKPQLPGAGTFRPTTQRPPALQMETEIEPDLMPEKSNKAVYWIIGIILLAVVAGAYYIYTNNLFAPDYKNLSETELLALHKKGDVEATLQLGRLAIHDMNLEEAKSYFEEAASQNNPKGLHNLACVNAAQGDVDECVSNLEKAVDLGFLPSKGMLATVLIKPEMGRVDEGLRLAKEAAAKGDKFGYWALSVYYLPANKHIIEGDKCETNLINAIDAGSAVAFLHM